MDNSPDPKLIWVEDEPRFLQDVIDELSDDGISTNEIEQLTTCTSFLARLGSITNKTKLVILDLWLEEGNGPTPIPIPQELRGKLHSTKRGVWLCRTTLESFRDRQLDVTVWVVSGNLDVDTLETLSEAGLSDEQLWKKPAPFAEFVSAIVKQCTEAT